MAIGITATPSVLNEEQGTVVTFTVNSTEPVPASGVVVNIDSDVPNSLGQFDVFATQFNNLQLVGANDDTSGFSVRLTAQTGTLSLPVFNDTDPDSPLNLTFAVQPGEGYTIDPATASTTVTIQDAETATQVQPLSSEPAASETATSGSEPAAATTSESTATTAPETTTPQTAATSEPATEVTATETATETTATEPAQEATAPEVTATETATETTATEPAQEATAATTSESTSATKGAPSEAVTVSLQTIAGAYDSEDNLIAPNIVQSLDDGASLLSFVLSADGEIPEEGVVVTVNSDIAFRDFFSNLGVEPFSPGGDFVGAVYNDEGEATGFKFRLDQAKAIINLSVKEDGGTDEPFDATFELAGSEGYTVNRDANTSTVSFYNTLDQVSTTNVKPEVSLSVDGGTLSESTGNKNTLTFNLSEPPPADGLLVYVKSTTQTGGEGDPSGRDIAEFDIFNAEVKGGAFPAPNFAANGFFFKITDQTASITLPAFDDGEIEGIEQFEFELQQAPNYAIAENKGTAKFEVVDNDASQIQVSLSAEPEVLIESGRTVSIHNFSLSATPPAEGVTVAVNAPKLGEFNLNGIQVEGGEIVGVNPDGFEFKINDQNAIIKLPVAKDGDVEGLDTATFSLLPGSGYQVSANADSATFRIADTAQQAPALISEITEPNDTIATAFDTKVNGFNPVFNARASIDYDDANPRVDATEDVDFYEFTVEAGDRVTLDVDANQVGGTDPFSTQGINTVLRLFDADGEEIEVNNTGNAPDEVFFRTTDAYIDFTATTEGTYYAAVSSSRNLAYNPDIAGTGSGNSRGEYELGISLNPDAPEPTVIPSAGTPAENAPTVSLVAATGTFDGTEENEDNILVPKLVQSLAEDENGRSLLTLSFNTTGEIPADGLEVFLQANANLADYIDKDARVVLVGANTNGPVYDSNGDLVGLKLKIFEPNASATFAVENLEIPETDGAETLNFEILPNSAYNVDENAGSTSVTFYDTLAQATAAVVEPGPQVGISLSNSQLIESEGTETTLTFNVDGEIPEDGVLVYVDSDTPRALAEIDLANAQVSGGAFPPANFDVSGFYFNVLEDGASITFKPFDEATSAEFTAEEATEGIESFTFNVIDSPGYTVNADASSISYTIADNPNSVEITPPTEEVVEAVEVESNDTIDTATNTNIGEGSSSFTISEAIVSNSANPNVDPSEDVDIYSFTLKAGETIALDIDAAELDSLLLYSHLRVFDTDGKELLSTNFDDYQAAPDEVFRAFNDPYLEFTATDAGTYYAGVSQLGNETYNPFQVASGSGAVYPDFGIETGEYTLAAQLI